MDVSQLKKTEQGDSHKAFHLILFIAISILYFFSNFYKVAVPGPIFNEVQSAYHCDAEGVVAVSSSFMYAYAFFQLIVGLAVDRYGGLRVITLGGALMTIFGLGCAFSPSLSLLCIGRALVGIGAACIYLSAVKEITRLFNANFSFCLGLLICVGYCGNLAGNTPFIALVHSTDWRFALAACSAVSVLVYLLFFALQLRDVKPDVQRTVKMDFRRFILVCKKKNNIFLMVTFNLSFSIYYSILTVMGKKYLEDYYGISAKAAGVVMSALVLCSCVNGLLMVCLCKHLFHNRRRPFVLLNGIGVLCAVLVQCLLLACDCHWLCLGIASLFAIAISVNMTPISASLIKETNAPDIFGTVMSFSNFTSYFLTAVLGSLMGWAMELFPPDIVGNVKIYGRNSYLCVFILLLLLAVISCSFCFKIRETSGQSISVD